MYESAKSRYDMISGRYLLTVLGLKLKLSEHVIKSDDGLLKGSLTTMVDLDTYEFKYLNTRENTPKESFMNDHAEEIYEFVRSRLF